MEEIEELKEEIRKIKERNSRVEADKAWETSATRMALVAALTYIVATITLFVVKNESPFVNAIIPSVGFLLSVQSVPFVKRWWVKKSLK